MEKTATRQVRRWSVRVIAVAAACLLAACNGSKSEAAAPLTPKTPNYARCAGSYEPEKCRAAEEALVTESATDSAARAKRLEGSQKKAASAVAAMPVLKQQEAEEPKFLSRSTSEPVTASTVDQVQFAVEAMRAQMPADQVCDVVGNNMSLIANSNLPERVRRLQVKQLVATALHTGCLQ